MSLKDLSGKTVYDIDMADFEKLFCRYCRYYGSRYCEAEKDIAYCKELIDKGIWDKFYRKK